MTTPRPNAVATKVTPLADGFLRVNEYEIEVETHDGRKVALRRQVMERGHAVGVLGYDPVRDEVVLGNELRPGMIAAGEYPFGDALIAGAIGPHETAIDAAVREMKEETGLDLREPRLVHPGAYVSPGGTSEKVAIVFGVVDSSAAGGVHGNADEQEEIRTVVLPAAEFIDLAKGGAINDMKTALAGWWLSEYRAHLHDR
jgi:ADP-ribose pyrophosphatase